jgi:hypothetical protein
MLLALAAIDSASGVTRRTALCFGENCEWVREAPTPEGYGVPAPIIGVSTVAGGGGELLPGAHEDSARPHATGLK